MLFEDRRISRHHARGLGQLLPLQCIDLDERLRGTLWLRDTVAKRSSGRGVEVLRCFHRLGPGWVMVAVYECWGDLYFETYDPAGACNMTLQVKMNPARVLLDLRLVYHRMGCSATIQMYWLTLDQSTSRWLRGGAHTV